MSIAGTGHKISEPLKTPAPLPPHTEVLGYEACGPRNSLSTDEIAA